MRPILIILTLLLAAACSSLTSPLPPSCPSRATSDNLPVKCLPPGSEP